MIGRHPDWHVESRPSPFPYPHHPAATSPHPYDHPTFPTLGATLRVWTRHPATGQLITAEHQFYPAPTRPYTPASFALALRAMEYELTGQIYG